MVYDTPTLVANHLGLFQVGLYNELWRRWLATKVGVSVSVSVYLYWNSIKVRWQWSTTGIWSTGENAWTLVKREAGSKGLYRSYTKVTYKNIHVSPRPTDSLKSLPTQKFYLNFRSKFFFISGISGPFPSSLSPFLHFTITRSFCWNDGGNGNENEKNFFFTYMYLPTLFLKGGSVKGTHTYF
jgi:hypothetical protein